LIVNSLILFFIYILLYLIIYSFEYLIIYSLFKGKFTNKKAIHVAVCTQEQLFHKNETTSIVISNSNSNKIALRLSTKTN